MGWKFSHKSAFIQHQNSIAHIYQRQFDQQPVRRMVGSRQHRLPFVRVEVIASRRVERVRREQALFFDGLPARELRGVLSRTCLAHRGYLSPIRGSWLALVEPQRKHVPDADLALYAALLTAFTPNPIPEFFG